MKTKITKMASHLLGFLLLSSGVFSVCGCSTHRDVDINSGDVRRRAFLLGLQINTHVAQSPFSREIRRLRIPTVDTRVWKPMDVSTLTERRSEDYDGAIADCNFLLQLLNVMEAPDPKRAVVLGKALSNLQAGELSRTTELITDVAEQLRAMNGLPPTPKEQRVKPLDRRLKF